MTTDLQEQCERGQQQLMEMDYLAAEATLAEAEARAWSQRDFDTLARLYMPLQEARRQIRLRCGEGIVCLDLIAQGPEDEVDGRRVIENYPHGQLLVGGWGTIEPAKTVRALQHEHRLYVETFLAAVYPVREQAVVVIVPLEDEAPPGLRPASVEDLREKLPRHSIILRVEELPAGSRKGDAQTFAQVMELWERLHGPFLVAADAEPDPLKRIEKYRQTIHVDYACELAHQKLSDVAKDLARQGR